MVSQPPAPRQAHGNAAPVDTLSTSWTSKVILILINLTDGKDVIFLWKVEREKGEIVKSSGVCLRLEKGV